MTTKLLAVTTTVANLEDARRIGHRLVQDRLAACVQMEAIESVYEWQGRVEQSAEVRLLCKTTRARWPALRDAVLSLHPYELPALYALDVSDATPAYVQWVVAQTTPHASR